MTSSFEKHIKPKKTNNAKSKKKEDKNKLESEKKSEQNIDIYDYIKNVKKELTKSIKEIKGGVLSEPYKVAIQEIQESIKNMKNDNKSTFLDEPILKKHKPIVKVEVLERKEVHDEVEKKKTQASQASLDRVPSFLEQSRAENRENNFKLVNKQMTKSQAKNGLFYEMEKERKIKKELRLDSLRNKKREDEIKSIKDRPTLTEVSKQIIKTKLNDEKPLYLRTSEIIDRKNHFIKNMQRLYYDKESNELTKNNTVAMTKNNLLMTKNNTNFLNTNQPYQNYYIASIAETYFNPKKFEEWRNFAMDWNRKKKEKNKKKKEDKENELFIDEISQPYKPLINSNSEFLASVIYNDVPIFQRLNNKDFYNRKQKNLERVYRETTPNFKPKIKKKVPSYLRNVESKLMSVSSAPDLTIHQDKKKQRGKTIHKSKTMNNSLNYSQSSLISKHLISKAKSVQSLKPIINTTTIKKTQSWVSKLDSINLEKDNEDINSPFTGSLYRIYNNKDIFNNIYYEDKFNNILFNFVPKRRSVHSLHSDRSSRMIINFSSEDNKHVNENFEESKVFSNSELKMYDLGMKK